MMRFMQWLHRWVGLVLVVQVLLWLASGLYFAFSGHQSMSGHQYMAPYSAPQALNQQPGQVGFAQLYRRYPSAESIQLIRVDGQGQYQITLPEQTLYLRASDGEQWQTDKATALKLALASYTGPGELAGIDAITGSDELPDWNGHGFRIRMADDLNTRIYVDAATSQVIEHRNTPWTLADWAFRLHFMDYSGGRSFNHLLIWSAGLLALWFSLSGLILLGRNLARGDFNPYRQKTWLEHLQACGQPIASSCGGGGTCGLCKVTVSGPQLPAPSAAGKAILSAEELEAGVRLSCQHRLSGNYEVRPVDENVGEVRLTLEDKRQLSPSITELTFVSAEPVAYQAGQCMQFSIPHINETLTRHYSMSTQPNSARLVFNVRQMPSPSEGIPSGIGSGYLCRLGVGDAVAATGPFGDFNLTEHSSNTQLFIGGGAGIAPLRALIQTELAKPAPRDCVFFYGARNESELIYREEFEQCDALTYIPVLSDLDEPSAWSGEVGYVHNVAMQWFAAHRAETVDVYVCGPPPMLKATLDALAQAGVPPGNIRFDDFGI